MCVYRPREAVVGENGGVGRVGDVRVFMFCGSVELEEAAVVVVVGLVVIVRGWEADVVLLEVVAEEVCAVAARDVGEPTVGADFAWKEGFVVVLARKAEKKFEKK